MAKQYFFQFSDGEYSDYRVGGLYACDHPVTEDEWIKHLELYKAENVRKRQLFSDELGRVDFSKLYAWQHLNNPETTFQALHNMVAVDCTEFWRS